LLQFNDLIDHQYHGTFSVSVVPAARMPQAQMREANRSRNAVLTNLNGHVATVLPVIPTVIDL